MFDLSEIEELFSKETLIKSRAFLRNAGPALAQFNDPNSTPEQKQQAKDYIATLDEKGLPPKQTKTPSFKGNKEAFTDLEAAVNRAKKKLHAKANEKLANVANINEKKNKRVEEKNKEVATEDRSDIRAHARQHGREAWHSWGMHPDDWKKLDPIGKKYLEDNEEKAHPGKKAEREEWNKENKLLPGSAHTKAELETQAKRAAGYVEKPIDINSRELSPEGKIKQVKNKQKSSIKESLDTVHRAHAEGLHDDAIAIMHSVPHEKLPSNMKGYNPLYMHYGVTPNAYAEKPEAQDDLHNFHNDVANGKHADNPHPGIQKVIQHLKKPKVTA